MVRLLRSLGSLALALALAQAATPTTASSSAEVASDSPSACEAGGAVSLTASGSNAVVTDSTCATTLLSVATNAKTNRTITAAGYGIQRVVSIPDADTLDLTQNAVSTIADLSSYASLKRLNGLTSLKGINWPATLQELDLTSNALPATTALSKLPLTTLDLTNTSLSDITTISLPSSLQTLNVAYNQLTSFKSSDSLNALTTLTLTTNSISSFKELSVPSAVESLDLSWNSLASFDGLSLPSSVTKLYLGGNRFTSLADLKTTNALTVLYVHDLPLGNLDGVAFPETVTALSLMNCSLTTLSGVAMPKQVVYLDISKNELTSIPTSYPDSMKSLTATSNQLTELYKIAFPNSATKLDFTGNSIRRVAGVSFPLLLATLNFGNFPITEFEIRRTDLTTIERLVTFNATITQTTCSNVAAQSVVVQKMTFCVIADDLFATQYGTSSSSPVASSSSSSSSSSWVLPVIICLAVLVVIALAAFVVRRRRASRDAAKSPPPMMPFNSTLANASALGNMSDLSTRDKQQRNQQMTLMTMGNMSAYNTMFSGGSGLGSGNNSGNGTNGPESSLVKYRIQTHEVVVQRALAHGGFGAVYLATYQSQDVVVKKILPEKASDDRCLQAFLDEIKLNSTLNHPKIVRFIGVSWNTLSDMAVIMEYMSNGDLDILLKQQHSRRHPHPDEFGWYQSHKLPCKSALALDVLDAIVYLHSFSSPIIHRDLKAKNVLLSENFEAKLSDFGVSKEWRVDATMTAGIGTMAWIAPEVLRGERYTEKADIYSFGVILTELATCAKPFEGITNALIVLKVTSGEQRPDMGDDCPEDIRELGLRCLSYDPSERPSAMVAHYELKTLLKAHSAFEL